MTTEIKIADVNPASTDYTQLSQAELVALLATKDQTITQKEEAYNNQKTRAEQAEELAKGAPETPVVDPVIEVKSTNTEKAPTPEQTQVSSLDDQYEIANLAKTLSLDEIKKAQSFVGTDFGQDLSAVANSDGFKTFIKSQREVTKSDNMISDDLVNIQTFQSKDQFVVEFEAGNLDLSDPEVRAKYIDIKSDEEVKLGY